MSRKGTKKADGGELSADDGAPRVGVFAAKTHFSELCDRVARQEQPVVVTRRGRPIVRIVPFRSRPSQTVWQARQAFIEKEGPIDEELVIPGRRIDDSPRDPLT